MPGGADYLLKTSVGRILCFLQAVYGFCIFGCVAATFFVERNAEVFAASESSADGEAGKIESRQTGISAWREEIRLPGARLNK